MDIGNAFITGFIYTSIKALHGIVQSIDHWNQFYLFNDNPKSKLTCILFICFDFHVYANSQQYSFFTEDNKLTLSSDA